MSDLTFPSTPIVQQDRGRGLDKSHHAMFAPAPDYGGPVAPGGIDAGNVWTLPFAKQERHSGGWCLCLGSPAG